VSETMPDTGKHLDEMTCLLYVERQLARERAQEVSAHTQSCAECRTLLRALERETRLLTRTMLEEEEALPARLAEFQVRARRSMQWIWGVVFGLAATGIYAVYTGYIEPWQQQLNQAGFGSSNLLGLLIFQGAFWKGWQSMFTLLEILALVMLAGTFAVFFHKRLRRGSALALMFAGLGVLLGLPAAVGATEFRHGETTEIAKDEIIKGDLFVSGARSRIDGTVDGDLFAFGQSVEVNGHVTGDVIVFGQIVRINGQVDGNVRSFANTITIGGTVGKNILSFGENISVDLSGKIGGSATTFSESLVIDGKVGRDVLAFFQRANVSGAVGREMRCKGDWLTFSSGAQVDGKIRWEGQKPADVSPQAKLAFPVEYTKTEHEGHRRSSASSFVWMGIWTAAVLLFGLVLSSLMPNFAREAVASAEKFGASLGLGVLIFFGALIASLIACVTIVGLPLGIASLTLWCLVVFCAQIVVGALVGQWIMGPSIELGPWLGRMAVGVVIVRVAVIALGHVPVVGGLFHLGIWMWGMGAVSLALYRRLRPVIAPGAPGAPVGTPLPPNTTVGGMQTA
jgi:hypothetical protein